MNAIPNKDRNTTTVFLSFLLLILSCDKNSENDPEPMMECEPNISFVADIQPIINSKCIMCHDGSMPIPDFRTYEVIKSRASLVKELTATRVMPKTGSLTDAQIKLIGCWVDDGAPDN
ncbi:MAG TPA: hypothetical protein VKZ54_11560 [Membranihabitans sp.]|nr:hypothetical protein [Membranihabitans sp.]